MSKDRVGPRVSTSRSGESPAAMAELSAIEALFSAGHVREITKSYKDTLRSLGSDDEKVRLLIAAGMAHYEFGDVVESISILRKALDYAQGIGLDSHFR